MPASDKKKMELLAPAGDMQSLEVAINNGADAVYFGYKEFNARANASNIDDLTKAIDLCHLFGVKAYLALNINIKNDEIAAVTNIIIEANNANIDAFIIADLSLLPIIKKLAPYAEVHASTQMGIHNRYGAIFLERMGFDRIILSREATLADINDIKNHINIPIEVFVQGAICVAFSGACLLSGILTGNSGNRGRCLQMCRQQYTAVADVEQKSHGYLLSPKDLCMIDNLKELEEAGVSSLKIEGRLKRPEYVGGAVAEYRKALDFGKGFDKDTIKKLYNRGDYTQGYGFDDKIIYPYAPNHIGLNVGKVAKIVNEYLIMDIDREILANDGFKILRNKNEIGGFTGKGAIRIGKQYKIKNTMNVEVGDTVSITTDSSLGIEIHSKEKKLPVDFEINLIAGEKANIKVTYKDIELEYEDDIVQTAKSLPLSENDIKEQISKLGGTPFEIKSLKVVTKNAFMAKSQLNNLKRNITDLLKDEILLVYERKLSRTYVPQSFDNIKVDGTFVELSHINQYTDYIKENIKNIVFSPYEFNFALCKEFYEKTKKAGNTIFLKPPIFSNTNTIEEIVKASVLFNGLICNNYYTIQLCLEQSKLIVLGQNMNIMNSQNPLIGYVSNTIVSTEINVLEMPMKKALTYAFGYLPLMYLVHCPKKTLSYDCSNCKGNLVFHDKKGYYNIYKQSIESKNCLHILKNGIITDIGSNLMKSYDHYIDLTDIDREDIDTILSEYADGNRLPTGKYTINHLKRGVK